MLKKQCILKLALSCSHTHRLNTHAHISLPLSFTLILSRHVLTPSLLAPNHSRPESFFQLPHPYSQKKPRGNLKVIPGKRLHRLPESMQRNIPLLLGMQQSSREWQWRPEPKPRLVLKCSFAWNCFLGSSPTESSWHPRLRT